MWAVETATRLVPVDRKWVLPVGYSGAGSLYSVSAVVVLLGFARLNQWTG